MALSTSCYVPLSHSIKAVQCGSWTPPRMRFVTSPLYYLHELDRQMLAKQMSAPQVEIAKSVSCSMLMIWFCFLLQNVASCSRKIALQLREK